MSEASDREYEARDLAIARFEIEEGYHRETLCTPVRLWHITATERCHPLTPHPSAHMLTCRIYVPDDGYLAKCAEICKKYNVLLICDEIQTGLCRTGKMYVITHKHHCENG